MMFGAFGAHVCWFFTCALRVSRFAKVRCEGRPLWAETAFSGDFVKHTRDRNGLGDGPLRLTRASLPSLVHLRAFSSCSGFCSLAAF